LRRRAPRDAHARLQLETADIIDLELRPEREARILAERDVVLHEGAKHSVSRAGRHENDNAFTVVPMIGVMIVHAPQDLMSTGQRKAVLDVEVDRVELVEKARIVAARAIVVDARAPSGLFIDRPAPACEDMAASQVARELSGR